MEENAIKLSEKAGSIIIDKKDIQMLRTLEDKFGTLMLGHSEFQMKNFIIEQFITPDRKHRQCLHELWARYSALISTWYETEKIKLDIRKLELKKESLNPVTCSLGEALEMDELDLELTHAKLKLNLSSHGLKETLREMKYFFGMMEKLQDSRKYDNYEEGEEEYWKIKIQSDRNRR
ncbi:MAG TPA: hypothetical protein VMX17_03765 [Candidatus Glassbacteria bacterium]|nr:hypothetical protein [Candidatus Glassbacteria bacterium]